MSWGPKNFAVVLDHVVVEKDNQMYMMMKYQEESIRTLILIVIVSLRKYAWDKPGTVVFCSLPKSTTPGLAENELSTLEHRVKMIAR